MLIYRHLAIMAHSERSLDMIALGKCEVPYTKSQYRFCTIIIVYKTGDSWGRTFFGTRSICRYLLGGVK